MTDNGNWFDEIAPAEHAALYDTVRAVGMEFCPRLGVSIPVGKDSMSMRTTLAAALKRGGMNRGTTC